MYNFCVTSMTYHDTTHHDETCPGQSRGYTPPVPRSPSILEQNETLDNSMRPTWLP